MSSKSPSKKKRMRPNPEILKNQTNFFTHDELMENFQSKCLVS